MPRTPPTTVSYFLIILGYLMDYTIFHKPRYTDEVLHDTVERHLSRIDDVRLQERSRVRLNHEEIVGQCNAFTLSDSHDLMFAVTIESGPLDNRSTFKSPIKVDSLTCMTDDQVAAFEWGR